MALVSLPTYPKIRLKNSRIYAKDFEKIVFGCSVINFFKVHGWDKGMQFMHDIGFFFFLKDFDNVNTSTVLCIAMLINRVCREEKD